MYVLSNGAWDTLYNLQRTSISLSVLNGFCTSNFFKIIDGSTKRDISFWCISFEDWAPCQWWRIVCRCASSLEFTMDGLTGIKRFHCSAIVKNKQEATRQCLFRKLNLYRGEPRVSICNGIIFIHYSYMRHWKFNFQISKFSTAFNHVINNWHFLKYYDLLLICAN